ncbi:MAG: tryptophan--tRNA ligase [Longimicrobiaceae bacterium]
MTRVLSGIQPSGTLHLGNYFGMMKPAVELQERGSETFISIVDFHALTTVRDPADLRRNTREVALDFLACGLDPDKAVLFRQSDLPEVTELAWILATVTPVGLLERCHAYKDKVARGLAATHALFGYPVLQAADILIVDADLVPVGQDQKQHLEVTRDIAVKLNERYGAVFKLPAPEIRGEVATVPGTDGQKMSKSYGNTVDLFAPERELRKQIMGIVTDSATVDEAKDPESSTLFQLYSLVASPGELAVMEREFRAGGVGYGEFKQRLFERVRESFAPLAKRRRELEHDAGTVDRVLAQGAGRVREVAVAVMERVRKAVGLR